MDGWLWIPIIPKSVYSLGLAVVGRKGALSAWNVANNTGYEKLRDSEGGPFTSQFCSSNYSLTYTQFVMWNQTHVPLFDCGR